MKYIHLQGKKTSLIINCLKNNLPNIIFWGKKLHNINDNDLELIQNRAVPQAFLDDDVVLTLLPEEGRGFLANTGLNGATLGQQSWSTQFDVINISADKQKAEIVARDDVAKLKITFYIALDENDIVQMHVKLTNLNIDKYSLQSLNLTLPVPRNMLRLCSLTVDGFMSFRLSE